MYDTEAVLLQDEPLFSAAWSIDVPRSVRLRQLREACRTYFSLHATIDSDLFGAEMIVAELVANIEQHTLGSATFSFDWHGYHPQLLVCDDGPGFACAGPQPPVNDYAETGRGLTIVRALAIDFEFGNRPTGGAFVRVTLPLNRSPLSPAVQLL
jgi:anti-sigma regulatory factor (Ser/Thr protein kinase)